MECVSVWWYLRSVPWQVLITKHVTSVVTNWANEAFVARPIMVLIWCWGVASPHLHKQHERCHLSFPHTHSLPSPPPSPAPMKGRFFFNFYYLLSLLTTPIRCPLKQNQRPPAHQNYVAGANTNPPTPKTWTSVPSQMTRTPVTVNMPGPVSQPPLGKNWPLPGKRSRKRVQKNSV